MTAEGRLAVDAAEATTLAPAGGSPVAALRCGTDGPAVLLVPGFTGSKEDFAPLLAPIAASGRTAWAIDLPGQYESPGPDDPGAYSVAALGAVLAALAPAVGAGRPVHLVGHSFGGLVARAAVLADPARWASLALMSSGPSALDGGRRERMERLRPVLAAHGLPGVYAAMLAAERAEPGYVAPSAQLAEFYRRRFVAGSPAMLEGMSTALVTEPDRVAELAALTLPRAVLYGIDDDAWPPAVQAEMAARLGVTPTVIPDAAHSPAVENPGPTGLALRALWAPVDGLD